MSESDDRNPKVEAAYELDINVRVREEDRLKMTAPEVAFVWVTVEHSTVPRKGESFFVTGLGQLTVVDVGHHGELDGHDYPYIDVDFEISLEKMRLFKAQIDKGEVFGKWESEEI